MAVQLFKLKIVVDSDITTDLHPDVKQYFYELDPADIDEGILTAALLTMQVTQQPPLKP